MQLNHSKIIKLITNNYHEKALGEMKAFATHINSKYVNEITSHQTKLNALKQDNRINILSREEYNRDIAKLTTAMLELLNNLKSFESKSNNEIKNTLKSETNNETFNINELYEKILKLYPKGIQDNRIWERSGGDISYFSQNNSPKEQWWDALKVLANGGGGDISYEKLISEIKKEFPTAL